MGQARRHHQVPQFYQRGFADGTGQVKVIRFGDPPQSFVTNIKNVAVENDFYKADWLGSDQADAVERLIGRVEQAAAESLRVLAEQRPLTGDHRFHIACWIVLQYVRGRGKRADTIGMQKTLMRADIALGGKELLATLLNIKCPAELEETWDRVIVRGDVGDSPKSRLYHLRLMFTTVLKIAPIYAQSRWQIVKFTRRHLFTSDQPVCLWRRPGGDLGIGLLTADMVTIPLNRKTGLAIFPQQQNGVELADDV